MKKEDFTLRRNSDAANGVTYRGICEEMPFDRNRLHATGFEVIIMGQYWDEYYNPDTDEYEYYR